MKAPPVEPPAWLRTGADLSWRLLVILAAIYVVGWFLVEIAVVSVPVILAAILTTLCVPPVRWLQERGLPRGLATGVVVVGGVVVLAGLTTMVVSRFVAAAPELGRSLSQAYDQVLGWLSSEPFGVSPDQVRSWLTDAVRGGGSQDGGGGAAGSVLSGTRMLIEVVAGFLLMLVLLFFFVKDGSTIARWVVERTPESHRDVVIRLGERIWDVLSRYLRGVGIVAAADTTGTVIGLLIIGVPLVLPLGVLMFLGSFVPVVGATVAGLIATLVALVSGGLTDAFLTLGLIVVVQQVDANILQPVVMGREVPLHPAVVLIAVSIGATLFSVVGAILAVPVAAVLSAVGNELRLMDAEEAPGGG